MEKTELMLGKIVFGSQVFLYKDKVFALLDTVKDLNAVMAEFHKEGILLDLDFGDLSTAAENKYNLLKGAFLRSDMDLVFFSDEGELYPANFFVGRILNHFVLKINDILASALTFCDEVEKYDERVRLMMKKKTFMVMMAVSYFTHRALYENDDIAKAAIERIREKFVEIKNLFDEFYKEDPFYNYPKIVEYELKRTLANISDKDKNELTADLVTSYEIDMDFLRTIKKEKEGYLIRKLYLKYMSEAGMDVSGIVEDPKIRYFTPKRHDIFDPTEYLKMSVDELVTAIFIEEREQIQDVLKNKEAFEILKNILRSISMTMYKPVRFTKEYFKASETFKEKKMT